MLPRHFDRVALDREPTRFNIQNNHVRITYGFPACMPFNVKRSSLNLPKILSVEA